MTYEQWVYKNEGKKYSLIWQWLTYSEVAKIRKGDSNNERETLEVVDYKFYLEKPMALIKWTPTPKYFER